MKDGPRVDLLRPSIIKVGAFDIAVKSWPIFNASDERSFGQFRPASLEIAICDFLPERRQAETMIHEILHAIWHVWALRQSSDEEVVVGSMAQGLAAVFRDNPDLLPWLASKLR